MSKAEIPKIKVGSIVTVNLGQYSSSSNTYIVAAKTGKKLFLHHPLAPDLFVTKNESEVNAVVAMLKNDTDRCLDFASKNRKYLGYNTQSELNSLLYYYILHKDLSSRQKDAVASICGKISTIVLKNDVRIAIELIEKNSAILDDYNKSWHEKLKPFFPDISKIASKNRKTMLFRIAGFVLAQIGDSPNG